MEFRELSEAVADRLTELTNSLLTDWATWRTYVFLLVTLRLAGLFTVGPMFGNPVIPWKVRGMLVVMLGLCVTSMAGTPSLNQPIPNHVLELAFIGIAEFALGAVIGLGVHLILSAFQLAGQLIDQQAGLAFSQVMNPATQAPTNPSGQFLYLVAIAAFLAMQPIGGHLWMVGSMLESFDAIPVGDTLAMTSINELLVKALQQSFQLAVRVAAPLLVVMTLISLAIGYLGRSMPTVNVILMAIPVRLLAMFMILSLSLSSIADAVVDAVPAYLEELGG